MDLHHFGLSLDTFSRYLKAPHSSVQTVIHKYEHHAVIVLRKEMILCSQEEMKVQNVSISPHKKAKELVKMLLRLVRKC